MSISEDKRTLKELAEHDFAYNIGDVVYLKTDTNEKYPMMIVGFDFEDYNCCDYDVTWLNSQGTQETGSFPEECLILKTKTDD